MVATLSGVASFHHIPLEGVEVRLTRKYNFTATEWSPRVFDLRIAKMVVETTLEGPLTDEQRRTLMHAAEHCPVHNTLAGEIRFDHHYV